MIRLPLVRPASQIIQCHTKMVCQGAEVLKGWVIFPGFKPLVLAVPDINSGSQLFLSFLFLFAQYAQSFF